MLRDSEEHGCLVPDRGSKAQRSWGSECGRGISLPMVCTLVRLRRSWGQHRLSEWEGEGPSCSEDSFLCPFLAPVWAQRDVGVGERQATRVGLTIHKQGLEGQWLPIPLYDD